MEIYWVEAFAEGRFSGNPAAVLPLELEPSDPGWMQQVAAEINLSETCFVWPESDGGFALRWFTPSVEVELCGHATLAAAAVLWDTGRVDPAREIRFRTVLKEYRLRSWLVEQRDGSLRVGLELPSVSPQEQDAPPEVAHALGATPVATAKCGGHTWLFELADAGEVEALRPDFSALLQATGDCVIVTAPAGGDPGIDVVSRFFAPGFGIAEDPVTGSAHCAIGPWWASRTGRREFRCRQASSRGGSLDLRVGERSVELIGELRFAARGEWLLSP